MICYCDCVFWSLKISCIIVNLAIAPYIMFFFETCKDLFPGHPETSSRTSEVVVGKIISVVTELFIPSMLVSCLLGHVDVDFSVNRILYAMYVSFLLYLLSF